MNATILVVDDSSDVAQILASMLKASGYEVLITASGALALQSAQASPPDMILLDIGLPDLNGFEVCQQLKANPRLSNIPIIFISALDATADKIRAFEAGGVDYITKPFQLSEVAARVGTHLRLHRLQLELEHRNEQVQTSYERLKHLEALRDNLTHMIVHDMRTPLLVVDGYLELLSFTDAARLSADGKHHIQAAREAAQNVLEMTRSLLDVSRMEAGEMPLDKAEHDLAALTRQVMEKMSALRRGRGLCLDAPDTPILVRMDGGLIARVMENLIANAMKHTPPHGQITVSVKVEPQSVQFSIVDNGPGIPAPWHQKIFEKFGQAGDDKRRFGTGLGLTFCKMAVEAHGGTIGLTSRVGHGSTFWFRLPMP
ncbi:MAG: hybrid sensor histidine kinase/response regulator [Verrucomicrobiota bacterium]